MKLPRLAILIACIAMPSGLIIASGNTVNAANFVPAVGLGTTSHYSVLGASTVTNTGNTTLPRNLGLSPGSSITGFPPGVVGSGGEIHIADASAQQAQADLSAAFIDGAGRSLTGSTPADLGGQVLQPGVYAGPAKGPLSITGTVVLDGLGNTDSVFIFQTDSTLITASGSAVALINGAQACRVYWVVGSSATLGTGSQFVGTIMAQASITVETGASVRGRTLARTGAVTLDSNAFTPASCQPPVGSTPTTVQGSGGNTPGATTTVPNIPATGSAQGSELLVATLLLSVGISAAVISRRRGQLRVR